MKRLRAIAIFALAVTGTIFGVYQYQHREVEQLRTQVNQLEVEKKQLHEFATRLAASRRVAQISVLNERFSDAGIPIITLQWQEIAHSGLVSPPIEVEILGKIAYFEACTIKFDHDLIGNGDAEKGETIVMYRRVFGDQQAPQLGPTLEKSHPPTVDGEMPANHAELWKRFWDMVEDPQLQTRYGVRVAQLEAPAVPVKVGQVWEMALDADGGLNLRRVSSLAPTAKPSP